MLPPCRGDLKSGGLRLGSIPKVQPSSELPRRRIHACVGDSFATKSPVGFDDQSCRASLSAKDTRRSCILCGSGSSMEQPTVTCHIIFIVGVIQTQSQDWAVPEIVRSSLISANAPRLFLTLLRALEVNIDLRHVNHIRYYYYYYYPNISNWSL